MLRARVRLRLTCLRLTCLHPLNLVIHSNVSASASNVSASGCRCAQAVKSNPVLQQQLEQLIVSQIRTLLLNMPIPDIGAPPAASK